MHSNAENKGLLDALLFVLYQFIHQISC